jgi:regulator of sigma E protease
MLGIVQIALTYTLPFLAVLTLVITVHELGHLLVARWCGVACDRFSIGFGRALASWRDKSGMEWRIGWIPFGGYVKFSGDEDVASVPDADDLAELKHEVLAKEGPKGLRRYFHFKPLWQRALVVAAGPVANFILAVVIFAVLALVMGDVKIKPRVGEVSPASPAAAAGFQAGDLILKANGRTIDDFSDLQQLVVLHTGEAIHFEVQRGFADVDLVATPVRKTATSGPKGCPVGLGCIGIAPSRDKADIQFVTFTPIGAVGQGIKETREILSLTLTYLGRVATGHESGDQLSGPLGILGASGHAAQAAIKGGPPTLGATAGRLLINLLGMAGFLSVAVGFANLLPIPVLDGGHLLFYGYEAIARRPLAARVQAAGYRVGFALLVGLMLFVTWNDLQRYRVFHLIGGLFS